MLPGKRISPEDLVAILLSKKWLLIIPVVVGLAGAVVISRRLPDEFRSETEIMVVPQRIPDSYVKSTVTGKIEDRLSTISQEIMSVPRLEQIITDLDLYRDLRRTSLMEDVVRQMRGDIEVTVDKGDSFRIAYHSGNAETAQRVTERLASLFIEENRHDRENLAEDTNAFLDSQLEEAKQRLIEHEKKLEEYRRRYSGELPSQAPANLQVIQSAQMQSQALAENSDRLRERRLLLERQMADLQSVDATSAGVAVFPGAGPMTAGNDPAAQQLQAAQAELEALLTHVKPDHPDVRILQRKIRDLEAGVAAENGRRPSSAPAGTAPVSLAEVTRQKRVRDLQTQMDDVDRELKDKQEQDRALRERMAEYQAKVDAVPGHESEMVELTRDYSTLQNTYASLLSKREESKIAANLEHRNISEQFKVLDPARVPGRPFKPNRLQIDLMGAGGGFVLGLLLIGFIEFSDSTFKAEQDIVQVLSLPVLAVVPIMTTSGKRGWRPWS